MQYLLTCKLSTFPIQLSRKSSRNLELGGTDGVTGFPTMCPAFSVQEKLNCPGEALLENSYRVSQDMLWEQMDGSYKLPRPRGSCCLPWGHQVCTDIKEAKIGILKTVLRDLIL